VGFSVNILQFALIIGELPWSVAKRAFTSSTAFKEHVKIGLPEIGGLDCQHEGKKLAAPDRARQQEAMTRW
jgi:hypothetical protein